jgi:serine/threonine-protein phosphatase 2A activator
MIKMYNAEVLSKFPVVQHFPFGSLFSWEQDPNASPAAQSVHTANQPSSRSTTGALPKAQPNPQEGAKAPWANQASGGAMSPTAAPWSQSHPKQVGIAPTKAPWASENDPVPGGQLPMTGVRTGVIPPPKTGFEGPTKAPWADQSNSRGS